ncbi:fungal-specific transcription factor domain-containing protein [Xylariaceae sp. FL1651]|nr:fungal-specific transcription factor domain-containing protein [Xylariaceae sp. FL1651]
MSTARAYCRTCTGKAPATRRKRHLMTITTTDGGTLCDGATSSTCAKCGGPKKKGQGHGLRLSWPNVNDSRRAVVGKSPSYRGTGHMHTSEGRFIHMSLWDIEMHNHLMNSEAKGHTLPILSIPLNWNPHKLEVKHQDLLQYFQRAASHALAVFGHDPTDLGNVLLRMALTNNTHSSTALLRSLLSFSSLHRHGVQSQASELKISALGALAAAAQGGELGINESVQHVAAGMLLYSFEIHLACCTSSQWTCYLSGVKKVINATCLNMTRHDDIAILLDWVYYNDIMARFSLRHWGGNGAEIPSIPPCIRSEAYNVAPSTAAVLEQLSDICDYVPVDSRSIKEQDDHKSFLKVLDWRIRSIHAAAAVDELYQLAALVYLDRISGAFLNQPLRTQQHIDKAFVILSQLGSCERQFPVFILGCEARTDSQRAIVLDLVSRTERNIASRSFIYVKLLIQAIWAQDDLVDLQNGELDYQSKLSSTMSRCAIPPSFV